MSPYSESVSPPAAIRTVVYAGINLLFNFGMAFTTRKPVLKIEKAGYVFSPVNCLVRFERIRDRGKRILSQGGFILRDCVEQGLFTASAFAQRRNILDPRAGCFRVTSGLSCFSVLLFLKVLDSA
jgi:hypothetical protein